MKRPVNPKKAAKLMFKFLGIDKALENNRNAISLAENAKDKKAVEVLTEVKMELIKIEQTENR